MNHKFFFTKISIVTPVFNQVEYIEQTINSVLGQNYPNLEYIIVDGGSTDGTLEILQKYDSQINYLISESDQGMYDALNKGFAKSTGEIMAWINSDDILLQDALFNMHRLFRDLPEVEWIQGLNSFIDLEGRVIGSQLPKKFSLIKFLDENFEWIQQESTFWRRSLWEKAGGKIDKSLKYAGDFELWFRFFQDAKLYNTSVPIGAWRKRDGQISERFMEDYLNEALDLIRNRNISKPKIKVVLKKIRRLNSWIYYVRKLKIFNHNYLIKSRERLFRLDSTEIKYSYIQQKFIIK